VDTVTAALRRIEELRVAIFDEAYSLLATETRNHRDAARRLARSVTRLIETARALIRASVRQLGQGARRDLAVERARVGEAARAFAPRLARAFALAREREDGRARRLQLVDPRRVVERGYAILRATDGRVIVDAAQARAGARVTAELKTGRLGVVSEGVRDE
jgi:exodeoxyribonuclease VII large subunit